MKAREPKGIHHDDPFHTGHKLHMLRADNKLTLEAAALELGIGRTTLGEYEEGVRIPARSFLETAARFYKVDLGFFYSTDRVSITNNHGNVAASSGDQHNTIDKNVLDRFLNHIAERDKRIEDLLARAMDRLGGGPV